MYIITLEFKCLEEWPSLEYGYGDGFFRCNKYDDHSECWVKELEVHWKCTWEEVLHVISYMAMYWLRMTVGFECSKMRKVGSKVISGKEENEKTEEWKHEER